MSKLSYNKKLADIRNISAKDRKKISRVHKKLKKLMETPIEEIESTPEYVNKVAYFEYKLQKLWGFSQAPANHTWITNDIKCTCSSNCKLHRGN